MVLVGVKAFNRKSDNKPFMILHFVDDGETMTAGNGTLQEYLPADKKYLENVGKECVINYKKSYDGKAVVGDIIF